MVGRPGFTEWVDKTPDPGWGLMPLTHIAKSLVAEDIIRSGEVATTGCEVFGRQLAYLFYGRPAYRISGDGAIRFEAACPFCFIFEPTLIDKAQSIFAFDTGAFSKRLYSRILMEEMKIDDFSLGNDTSRPNRLISAVFRSKQAYFDGDVTEIDVAGTAKPSEFHAKAYLDLIASPGRNEPDDRVCSIEVIFGESIPILDNLRAVIVPHTLWSNEHKTPWLDVLEESGVEVAPYLFVPGRHPEYYQALLETEVKEMYSRWGIL